MKRGFRQTMAWLHTWAGLLPGWVLYFVFVTGTVGYFQIEIGRWMQPELPLTAPVPALSDMLGSAERYLRREAAAAEWWSIELPFGRHGPDLRVFWTEAFENGQTRTHARVFDWNAAAFREPPMTRDTGGGYELYRMHYNLRYMSRGLAYAIVGVCTMFMLVAIVSGIVTHKRIFKDLFTFRPGTGQRAWLDGHNAVSVLALPFIVMITYSGLVFIMTEYMPAAVDVLYGDERPQMGDDIFPQFERPRPAHRTAPMLPLAHFLADVRRQWGDRAEVWRVRVVNPGDANARIEFWDAGMGTVGQEARNKLNFDAVDGHLLESITDARSVPVQTESAFFGLHEGLFAGPLLRWLYFASGVFGCVMIATGLVLWTVKRRAMALRGSAWGFGHDLVERLNIGTVVGLPIAVAVYFWANRLLPVDLPNRAAWEMHSLFIAWGLMFAYAAGRPLVRAWIEECSIGAGAFALLPLVNALTTDRHLGVTIPAGDWALAGFDLTVLCVGIVLGLLAFKIGGRAHEATMAQKRRALSSDVAEEVG